MSTAAPSLAGFAHGAPGVAATGPVAHSATAERRAPEWRDTADASAVGTTSDTIDDEKSDDEKSDDEKTAGAGSDATAGTVARPREIGGREGPEPTRFGDWEKSGRCIDF